MRSGAIRPHRLATLLALVAPALAVASCGGAAPATSSPPVTVVVNNHSTARASTTAPPPPPKPAYPPYPQLLPAATATGASGFVPAVRWHGRTAAWVARTPSGVALLSFDQSLTRLRLHSGTIDAGGAGWRFGPAAAGSELARLVGAFNGGFRLSTGAGGFESYGRVAVPLQDGLGSIVTYSDGTTDIGAWQHELPPPGRQVVSVRQNLALLIDHGTPASTVDCRSCWGATLGGVDDPARSALGVTADGRLIWAGGEHLTVADLAGALVGASVTRAVELDINPAWVSSFLYGHRSGRGPLAPVPMVPGQTADAGRFLTPYSRDFFTIVTR